MCLLGTHSHQNSQALVTLEVKVMYDHLLTQLLNEERRERIQRDSQRAQLALKAQSDQKSSLFDSLRRHWLDALTVGVVLLFVALNA